MHPAFSVIVFTTLSGAGFGTVAMLGVLPVVGWLPAEPRLAAAGVALGLGLAAAGLLSSTLHLSHPERAWRALSQWRSSWLSREGLLALATFPPAACYGLAGWLGWTGAVRALLGLLVALLAVLTVIATAMIYRSLKPVHQWHNGWVVPVYLGLAGMTGLLLLNAVAVALAVPSPGLPLLALAAIVVAAGLKLAYWHAIDTTAATSTPASAIGLPGMGPARLLEGPHTEPNYLMREMGFRIARKHAHKLRRIAVVAGFAIPALLTLLAASDTDWLARLAAVLAVLSALSGVLVERWLFFAEAKHVVTLYYGAEAA